MRQIFTGLVAAIAVGALGASPAMACGGGGLFSSACAPCGQAYVSPCGHGGYGHFGYSHYQRLAVPTERLAVRSPRYFWVNQGPVYDGPGQFAPRPYYEERSVLGWSSHRHHHYRHHHYGYTGGPYANPINHYSYGAPAVQGPVITSYRWGHHARRAHLHRGHSHSL